MSDDTKPPAAAMADGPTKIRPEVANRIEEIGENFRALRQSEAGKIAVEAAGEMAAMLLMPVLENRCFCRAPLTLSYADGRWRFGCWSCSYPLPPRVEHETIQGAVSDWLGQYGDDKPITIICPQCTAPAKIGRRLFESLHTDEYVACPAPNCSIEARSRHWVRATKEHA